MELSVGAIRALRRRIFTPDIAETKVAVRGFHDKGPEAREVLETVGASFLAGLSSAAGAREVSDVDTDLGHLPTRFKGFAYEGAGMGFALVDAMTPGRPWRSAAFLAGPGDPHVYMAYVGIGWALARLPRPLWRRASAAATDPLLRWLVLDGYGFHQAYFRTDEYVFGRRPIDAFPWPPEGPAGYAARVVDQGIGRATWFVAGADPKLAADLIDAFPAARRQDLYSGAGLAATYAGGVSEQELRLFQRRAGEHAPFVAQASAFAAQARVRAGLLVPHNDVATQVLCGMNAIEAGQITDEMLPTGASSSGLPAYEVWRRAVAARFADLRVSP
jgi:enediyne biosynthesis protein E3